MRALTIHQPWATLIAMGHKKVENRRTRFTWRGPLAIHAGKQVWDEGIRIAERLGIELPRVLPLGKIVAIAELYDCVPFDYEEDHPLLDDPFACGPFCLLLRETVALRVPVQFRGQQGLFYVPDSLVEGQ